MKPIKLIISISIVQVHLQKQQPSQCQQSLPMTLLTGTFYAFILLSMNPVAFICFSVFCFILIDIKWKSNRSRKQSTQWRNQNHSVTDAFPFSEKNPYSIVDEKCFDILSPLNDESDTIPKSLCIIYNIIFVRHKFGRIDSNQEENVLSTLPQTP